MKKLSFIVMACLMVLGLTQCKKNETSNNNNADNGDRVSITLKLENGGQKVHPEEENGLANIVYDNGDVVYVGSNGKYMGYLTYNGTLFTGSINAAATVGQPLQFIFMGGQDFHSSLTENSTEEYTFNIGDQSAGLAVISCAASNEDFSATNLSYTAYLRNKCALVKFGMGNVSTNAKITLSGLKNTATIGFDGTVTNGTTTGDIVTYGTGLTRYAVVLSDQGTVTDGTISAEGYEGTFSIPTAAYTNAFLTDASMTLTATGPTNPEGAINGLFSVSSTKQVYFSQGNLQYVNGNWQFAEHQYTVLGYWIGTACELFFWGGSSKSYGTTEYYSWGGESTSDVVNWGENAISNGGNEAGLWRTLSKDEWVYLFNTRTDASSKYGAATVCNVNGVVVLPDDWTLPGGCSFTSGMGGWSTNTYDDTVWAKMEAAGAVFLPAAGIREGHDHEDVGYSGRYWSSTAYDGDYAWRIGFNGNNLDATDYGGRLYGESVRLVRDAN